VEIRREMKAFRYIKDGFQNIMKGIGTAKDARTHTTFVRPRPINQQTANNMYAFNWLAAKVVDCAVDDGTRKWRKFLIEDDKKKEEVEAVMTALDIKSKVNQAEKWARVFGGSAILVIIDGDNQEEPLDIDNIRRGSLANLIVLDRYNIYSDYIDRDILSPNFGRPEYYTVSRGGQKIHHTRLVIFQGWIPTLYEWEQNNFWGSSIFQKVWEPIENSQITSQSIGNLVLDSNVDVYKIKGLNDMVASQKDDLVVKRLQIAHEMKSIINGIALDGEDSYEKKSNTFASLADIDDRFVQKVAGASGIPVTKLLGISPAGQNATGESDMRNYYDDVSCLQENIFRPALKVLDAIILSSHFGEFETPGFEFLPLRQLSDSEQAEVDLKKAQRDEVYFNLQIVSEMDIFSNLAQCGTYSGINAARVVEREKELKEEEGDFEGEGGLEEGLEKGVDE
jgi:phage-related protein (TIGR01555 family)